MFYDRAKIYLRSGNGGDGMISFRREAHVPLGGPDGGDGGDGGDIILAANAHLNSLIRFHRNNHHRATDGVHGNTRDRTGARGKSLRLEVPVGTIVREAKTEQLLADLVENGQEVVIVKGGRRGRGNARFVNSRNQAPRIAERGEPGKEMWVTLELKLIADVGIVGVPNAGKSTLLSVVSAAKPKIANYPFTTLQPNLGVVTLDNFESMVLADIPGLIEGAADGIGLGHDFLRHVERTRVLIHLLDGNAKEPLEDWRLINDELRNYKVNLFDRPQLVVLNKMDSPEAIAWEPIIEEVVTEAGYEFMSISAVTNQGTRPMLYRVWQMLQDAPDPRQNEPDLPVIRPDAEDENFSIVRLEADKWEVTGERIERVASMTYFEYDDSLMRFQKELEESGVSKALTEAGVKLGDTVFIGEHELEWGE